MSAKPRKRTKSSISESEKSSKEEELKRQISTNSMSKQTHVVEMTAFRILVLVSQCVGLACVGLVFHWANLYGGLSWKDKNLQFNWHPVLMVVGLIFFYGDAIIVYRVFSFLPKTFLKIIHAVFHLGAVVLAVIGVVAVFENHRRTHKADLYSLHSWVGLATVIMFGVQYVAGFVTYLVPGIPLNLRVWALPYHRFFGMGIFFMSIASALMGMTQKLIWTDNYMSNKYIPEGKVGNALGLLLVIFGFLVAYLATKNSFKRRPLPEELPATVSRQQKPATVN